jgi:hypothetical protein
MRAALLAVVAAGATASAAPLSTDHEKLACADCHVRGDALDRGKCLGCHGGAARPVGLHATIATPGEACEDCHHEHRGAGFDLRGWDALPPSELRFDHAAAGWTLTGHDQLTCTDCHTRVDAAGLRTYLGFDGLIDAKGNVDCRGCHAHANVHDGKWKSVQCRGCHTPSRRPRQLGVVFHGPDSGFPLVGGHRGIGCRTCHRGVGIRRDALYTRLDPTCDAAGCHADVHAGRMGARCVGCHVIPASWDATEGEELDPPLETPSPPPRCRACHADRSAAR